jgi:hypothetical protein
MTRMKNEKQMTTGVERYLNTKGWLTAREVPLGTTRFDLVGYNKKAKSFIVVECKRTRRETRIGQTFGQAEAYLQRIRRQGLEFIDAVSKKLPAMRFRRWMQATKRGKRFYLQFYVALPNEACLELEVIQGLKSSMPHLGVIRVKPSGHCRSYIYKSGKVYKDLAAARPVRIPIATSSAWKQIIEE